MEIIAFQSGEFSANRSVFCTSWQISMTSFPLLMKMVTLSKSTSFKELNVQIIVCNDRLATCSLKQLILPSMTTNNEWERTNPAFLSKYILCSCPCVTKNWIYPLIEMLLPFVLCENCVGLFGSNELEILVWIDLIWSYPLNKISLDFLLLMMNCDSSIAGVLKISETLISNVSFYLKLYIVDGLSISLNS